MNVHFLGDQDSQGLTESQNASAAPNAAQHCSAKDFDQVHASTNLVTGLLERGEGLHLKLKSPREMTATEATRGGFDDGTY